MTTSTARTDSAFSPEHPEPTYDGRVSLREGSDRGVYEVVLGIPDESEPRDAGNGIVTYRFRLGGEPHVRAYVASVVAQIGRPDESVLKEAAAECRRVTLLLSRAPHRVEVREVRLFEGSRGLGMLPKGARSKGFVLHPQRVLAVYDGWGDKQREEALGLFQACANTVPVVRELTREDLAACFDPREAAQPGDPDFDPEYDAYDLANTKAVVHFTHPGFDYGDGPVPGCEFHITYSIPNEDNPDYSIYGGMFFAPPGSYLVSEHGSFYEKDLLSFDAGLVIAPPPATANRENGLYRLSPAELFQEQQRVEKKYYGRSVSDPTNPDRTGRVVGVTANPYGGNPDLDVEWEDKTVSRHSLAYVILDQEQTPPTPQQPTIHFGPDL